LQHVVEITQAIGVQQVLQDDGVIEGLCAERGVHTGVQAEMAKGLLALGEQAVAFGGIYAGAVGLSEAQGEADEEVRKEEAIVPHRRCLAERHGVIARREKRHGPAHPDEGGEGLVEVGMAAEIGGGVKQFVEDDLGERDAVVAQEIGQQRVRKPA
jgi:hypothetical protein